MDIKNDEIIRECEIDNNRLQIIYDNMTWWQYYEWDMEDIYNQINFNKIYIDNKTNRWEKSIYQIQTELMDRLIKVGVIKEKTKEQHWEERNRRLELKRKEDEWEPIVKKIAKILSFKKR